jgi:hypothetical protein
MLLIKRVPMGDVPGVVGVWYRSSSCGVELLLLRSDDVDVLGGPSKEKSNGRK